MGKNDFLKKAESDADVLSEFLSRKAMFNSAMVVASLSSFPPTSSSRGVHVAIRETHEMKAEAGAFDWYPLELYHKYFEGEPEKLGHSRMPHRGVPGVAVFHKPAGVVTISP
jgi:hypothetical protein